ncbi:MAG: nitroreductase family deazaflavin-dependent oxidoreductase [Actinomycetota bacterium]|nr:MAG: nitroreductase family deazaflavin-dependent oxidoreductase [Actinomycetota bacterium]
MPNKWNEKIIAEFRANEGKVGGPFEGSPLVLLTTRGAKTGTSHTTPVMYLADGDRVVVFASVGGGPRNPDWYYNLLAHPEVSVEQGTQSYDAVARPLQGEERDRLYARQAELFPVFADYEVKAPRVIPVVGLERV